MSFAWRHLDPVGVPDPEPPLGDLGDRVSATLDRVLVVDDIALDVQVRAASTLTIQRSRTGVIMAFLTMAMRLPRWILDLHAVLDPEHAFLDLAQFVPVHVLEQQRLADPQGLAVHLEYALTALRSR